jgi:hypothetical protein
MTRHSDISGAVLGILIGATILALLCWWDWRVAVVTWLLLLIVGISVAMAAGREDRRRGAK